MSMSAARVRRTRSDGSGQLPSGPSDLRASSWLGVLMRTVRQFRTDDLSDWAAALTYRGLMSLTAGTLVVVAGLGMLGQGATQRLLDNVGQLAPSNVKSVLNQIINNVQSQGKAGLAAVIGIALALYSASNYIAGFMRASNAIYEIGEGRPVWKTFPVRIGVTIAMVVLIVVSAAIVVFTGPVADQLGTALGVGHAAVTAWDIAKWPVLLLIVSLMLSILYYACPNVKQPGFRWVSPGGVVAVLIWLVASALFAFYVANFGSYNKTYGTLAGVIVFLVWLWLTNVAVLLGAGFNAELLRARAIQAEGDTEPASFVEPRDTRKLTDGTSSHAAALGTQPNKPKEHIDG
jgi:membrane protein